MAEITLYLSGYLSVKSNYATVVNSATSALHLSCLALGLKKNDYLWTTSNTFVSSANCALYCGAKVDLVLGPSALDCVHTNIIIHSR